jgi:hypothetical protein
LFVHSWTITRSAAGAPLVELVAHLENDRLLAVALRDDGVT